MKEIKPDQHSTATKKEQVEHMFDSIAPKYDFLNHFLSAGIDKSWRKKAIDMLKPFAPMHILDVATGTGDLAIESLSLQPEVVTGIDLSEQMLEVGRAKLKKLGLDDKIDLIKGDGERLPFMDESFDVVMIAFGIRNFQDPQAGLKEMRRVLKTGGHLMVLEFSKPTMFPFRQVFNLYFKYLLPTWGRMISKSSNAYRYLPESVKHFPQGQEFAKILANSGFKNIIVQPLTLGTCSLYLSEK